MGDFALAVRNDNFPDLVDAERTVADSLNNVAAIFREN
jgi:hypothetical protein